MSESILVLPEIAQNTINKYLSLPLGGKQVVCPYYINVKRNKDLRVMVGKGTPEEIVMEAKIWEKLKGADFSLMSAGEIRQFLIDRGLGVDCSGFVVHVLDSWHKRATGKHLWDLLKIPYQGLLYKVAYKLKPVEKLGAEIITNEQNSVKVNINDARPGDLIRAKWKMKNSHHVLLVSKVVRDENNVVKKIEYVSSTRYYGDKNGIKFGEIEITDINKPLSEQKWTEVDDSGFNHTFEGFMVQVEDNGLRRLKCMEKIIS